MATGFFNRVYDTNNSGSVLQAALSGNDVRGLEISAALSNPLLITASSGPAINTSTDQLAQALINSQGIDTGTAGTTSYVNIGPDVSSQAQAFINMFNLSSTNQTRLLRFHQTTQPVAGKNCYLRAGTGSSTFIKILSLGASGGTANSSQVLFDGTIPGAGALGYTGPLGASAGIERLVLVGASTLTSGSEVVNFTILSGSM